MTLLAGFDMVIEISRSALEGLIGSASLGGQSLTPPTEMHQASGPNSIDLMVLQPLSLSLSPGATNWATIDIPFEDSTFTLSGTTLGPVKGTLSIAGFFEMLTVNGTDPNKPPFAQQVGVLPEGRHPLLRHHGRVQRQCAQRFGGPDQVRADDRCGPERGSCGQPAARRTNVDDRPHPERLSRRPFLRCDR